MKIVSTVCRLPTMNSSSRNYVRARFLSNDCIQNGFDVRLGLIEWGLIGFISSSNAIGIVVACCLATGIPDTGYNM